METQGIIRKRRVIALTGLSDTTIWRYEKEGRFPKRRHIGKRAVGWFYNEIMDWMQHCQAHKNQ